MSVLTFGNSAQWFNTVTTTKKSMSRDDLLALSNNEICILCSHPYTEPSSDPNFDLSHFLAHTPCCGTPIGHPCLAIALFYDHSFECPFCQASYPDPSQFYPLEAYLMAQLREGNENENGFSMTKEIFDINTKETKLYSEHYQCWKDIPQAPVNPIQASSKDSFSAADLEDNAAKAIRIKISSESTPTTIIPAAIGRTGELKEMIEKLVIETPKLTVASPPWKEVKKKSKKKKSAKE